MTDASVAESILTSEGQLEGVVAALFEAVDVPSTDAHSIAETLVFADMRGVESHGVQFAPRYVRGLSRGLLNPAPKVSAVRERGAIAVLDGDNGLGFISARAAIDLAVELARRNGIGCVTVRHSNHFGPAAFYAMRALEAGMIGHATTDGPPHTVAWGSREPVLSNDPVAWAFPTGGERPIVLDTAFTGVKEKIRLAAQRGRPIPGDWAVGPDGRPTTDAEAALRGALLPIGQHKGSGLIMANELLCGALAGANFSFEVSPALVNGADHHDEWGCGHFLLALDIEAFVDRADFERRATELTAAITGAPKATGIDRIYMPGELEDELAAHRRDAGLPLARTTLDALDLVAREVGAPVPSEQLA